MRISWIRGFLLFSVTLFVPVCFSQELFRQRETNPNYDQGDWISYSNARNTTSIAVGDRYVYFGTLGSGVARYHQFENRWHFPWTTSNGLADNQVWTVAFDFDTGYLWCATHTAISYYQATAERWTNLFKDEFGLPVADEIESIGISKDFIVFATQGGRLFEVNKFGGAVLNADNRTNDYIRSDQVKWFGRQAEQRRQFPHFFMNNGYLFDPTGIVEDFRFNRARIVASVEDNWGNLWVATNGLGAGKGDVRSLRLEMLDFGLKNPAVHAMTIHQDHLWTGGSLTFEDDRGITSWDLGREVWSYFEQRDVSEIRSDDIYAITPDGDNLWFSTGHGLTRYSVRERTWKTFDSFDGLSDNLIFDTVVDDSSIWVATSNGIDRILKRNLSKKDSLNVEQIGADLTTVRVYDLEFMENLLWAGTSLGVYVYDVTKLEGGYSSEIEGPLNRAVRSISRYKDELWFGSSDGIDVYDVKKKAWLGVPEGGFFSNQPINKVVASEKAVWAATDKGVLKFDRRSRTWRRFTVEDGLIANRVNTVLLDGDYVWFGTDRGLTQFYWNDPSRID